MVPQMNAVHYTHNALGDLNDFPENLLLKQNPLPIFFYSMCQYLHHPYCRQYLWLNKPFVKDLQEVSSSLSRGEVQISSLIEHQVQHSHHVTRVRRTVVVDVKNY